MEVHRIGHQIHRESVGLKFDVFPVQGAGNRLHLFAEVQHVDIGVFIHLRGVQQLDGHVDRHRRGLFHAVHEDGDVQGLGIGHLAAGDVQRLSGPGGVGVGRVAGQLGDAQSRPRGNARLGAIADLDIPGVAGGVYVMGGDGLGDDDHVHGEGIRLKGDVCGAVRSLGREVLWGDFGRFFDVQRPGNDLIRHDALRRAVLP